MLTRAKIGSESFRRLPPAAVRGGKVAQLTRVMRAKSMKEAQKVASVCTDMPVIIKARMWLQYKLSSRISQTHLNNGEGKCLCDGGLDIEPLCQLQ